MAGRLDGQLVALKSDIEGLTAPDLTNYVQFGDLSSYARLTDLNNYELKNSYRINITDYGAVGNYTTDSSGAIDTAIGVMNGYIGAGQPAIVYVPPGFFRVKGTTLRQMTSLGFVGDGPHVSNIIVDPDYIGDLFSWGQAWYGTHWIGIDHITPQLDLPGPYLAGITAIFDRTAPTQQNFISLYDWIDNLVIHHVEVYNCTGWAMKSGLLKDNPRATLRESFIDNFRAFGCGSNNVDAVVDFFADDIVDPSHPDVMTTDGADEVMINGLTIFQPIQCDGLLIHTGRRASPTRNLYFSNLRIEGSLNFEGKHMCRVGKTEDHGWVQGIFFKNALLSGAAYPYANFRLEGSSDPTTAIKTYGIEIDGGAIGYGIETGFGIDIAAGRDLHFRLSNVAVSVPERTFRIGNVSQGITAPITFDMNGLEDSSAIIAGVDRSLYTFGTGAGQLLRTPGMFRYGNVSFRTDALSAQFPDGAIYRGASRGPVSVDLQRLRDAASQVASGYGSAILGGQANGASGQFATVINGLGNNADWDFAQCIGLGAWNKGRYGGFHHADQILAGAGDAQSVSTQLIGIATGTGAKRLTSDRGTAGARNVLNLMAFSAISFKLLLVAMDTANPGNCLKVTQDGLIHKGATNGTTGLASSGQSILSAGTGVNATVAISQDTTNGGLNVSFTPPPGNTATWYVVANIFGTETRA